jgi:hypothetical protein
MIVLYGGTVPNATTYGWFDAFPANVTVYML